MLLDGLLGRTEFSCDLLVEQPGRDQRKHLALARSQSLVSQFQITDCACRLKQIAAAFDAPIDRAEKIAAPDRLLEKIHGAGLHRRNAGRNVTVPGDENDREIWLPGVQRSLKLEAVHSGHPEV